MIRWNDISNCIKGVAKEIFGESKGFGRSTKETLGWSKEVQASIRSKRSYRSLPRCRENLGCENNIVVKSKVKKVVQEAKQIISKLYSKLGMNDEEKNIYNHAKTREMKRRDLNGFNCIKELFKKR